MYIPTSQDMRKAQELRATASSTINLAMEMTHYATELSLQLGVGTKDILAGLLLAGAVKPHTRET